MLQGTPAALAVCQSEEALFMEGEHGPGGTYTNAYGSAGTIFVRDRDLDSCPNPNAASTAHLANGTLTKFAEVGWVEVNSGGAHSWNYFYEGQSCGDFDTCGWGGIGNGGSLPSAASSGYWARFWLNNKNGTVRFNLYVDKDNDGSADHNTTTPDLGFSHGTPHGETARVGGNGTGALDHQKKLGFQDGSDVWHDWARTGYGFGGINNWHYVIDGPDEYETAHD
jgi:hypothetical protein